MLLNMTSEENKVFSEIEKVINEIETGQLKIGDIVYCTEIMHNVIILEFPRRELIEEYYEEKKINEFPPFTGRIKYKTKGRGKIGFASIATIVKLQEKNFSVEFSISREIHRSSDFFDIISEAKNEGMTVKRKVDPKYYHYSIYGETQNALYDAFSGYFSSLEELKWFKHENGEKIELEFI